MEDRSEFNEWFEGVMRRNGWSQMDVAFMLGVHVSTVSKWTAGSRAAPSYGQLLRIVSAFGELPDDLRRALERHGQPPPDDDPAGHRPYTDDSGPAPPRHPIWGPRSENPIATDGARRLPARTGYDRRRGR